MAPNKPNRPKLTAEGPKLGQGRSRKAATKERLAASKFMPGLLARIGNLERRVDALERKKS